MAMRPAFGPPVPAQFIGPMPPVAMPVPGPRLPPAGPVLGPPLPPSLLIPKPSPAPAPGPIPARPKPTVATLTAPPPDSGGVHVVNGSADLQREVDMMPAIGELTSTPEWQDYAAANPDKAKAFVDRYHKLVTTNSTAYKNASPDRRAMMDARIYGKAAPESPYNTDHPWVAALKSGFNQSTPGDINLIATGHEAFDTKDYQPETTAESVLQLAGQLGPDIAAFAIPSGGTEAVAAKYLGGKALSKAITRGLVSGAGWLGGTLATEPVHDVAAQMREAPGEPIDLLRTVRNTASAATINAATGYKLPAITAGGAKGILARSAAAAAGGEAVNLAHGHMPDLQSGLTNMGINAIGELVGHARGRDHTDLENDPRFADLAADKSGEILALPPGRNGDTVSRSNSELGRLALPPGDPMVEAWQTGALDGVDLPELTPKAKPVETLALPERGVGGADFYAPPAPQPEVTRPAPDLAASRRDRIDGLQAGIERMQAALPKARGDRRGKLQDRIAKAQSELSYLQLEDIRERPTVEPTKREGIQALPERTASAPDFYASPIPDPPRGEADASASRARRIEVLQSGVGRLQDAITKARNGERARLQDRLRKAQAELDYLHREALTENPPPYTADSSGVQRELGRQEQDARAMYDRAWQELEYAHQNAETLGARSILNWKDKRFRMMSDAQLRELTQQMPIHEDANAFRQAVEGVIAAREQLRELRDPATAENMAKELNGYESQMRAEPQPPVPGERHGMTPESATADTSGELGNLASQYRLNVREIEQLRDQIKAGSQTLEQARPRLLELMARSNELKKRMTLELEPLATMKREAGADEDIPAWDDPVPPRQQEPGYLSVEAARARIAARRSRLNVGIDPEALIDYAILGADKLIRGITDFRRWSVAMLQEHGAELRPYLRDLWEKAHLQVPSVLRSSLGELGTVGRGAGEHPAQGGTGPLEAAKGTSPLSSHERLEQQGTRYLPRPTGDVMTDGMLAAELVMKHKGERIDVRLRDDTPPISFVWGELGSADRAFENGHGIAHILLKRAAQGEDSQLTIRRLVEAITRGRITKDDARTRTFEFLNDDGQTHRAIVKKVWDNKEQHFLVSGYEVTSNKPVNLDAVPAHVWQMLGTSKEALGGVGSASPGSKPGHQTDPTHVGPTANHPDVGARADSNPTRSKGQEQSAIRRILGQEEGSSNFLGALEEKIRGRQAETLSIPAAWIPKMQRTGTRNGHDVYTVKGQEWELVGIDNGRATIRRTLTPAELQRQGAGHQFNELTQPLQNAGADQAKQIRSAANTGRLGEVIAGKFMEDLKAFTKEQRARMHKALDNPTKYGAGLSAEERAMVDRAKAMMDEAGNEGVAAKVIGGKLDVYAPHVYEDFENPVLKAEGTGGTGPGNRLSTYTPHSKQRTFATLDEAEAAGLSPIYDLGAVANVYAGMKRKIAAAHLLDDLRASTDANGRKLVLPKDQAPHGYVSVANPVFEGERVAPEVASAVRAFAEAPAKTPGTKLYTAYMKAKQATIGWQLMYPMVHLSNVYSKFVWKGVGLGDIRRGHEIFVDEGLLRDAIAHDVNVQGNALGPIHEMIDGYVNEQRGLLERIDPTPGKQIAKASDAAHKFLWDNVRAMQLGAWEKIWRQMEAKGQPRAEAKKAAAAMVNNWTGMIPREDMSDGLRRFANVMLYSRGWTLGNLKNYEVLFRGEKALAPDIRNTEAGRMAAQTMRNSFLLDLVANKFSLAVLNGMMAKAVLGRWQWPWQNEDGKQDRVLIGQNPDGTLRYSQLPLFKFTEDFTESIPLHTPLSSGEPGAHWWNKTSPLVRSTVEAFMGHDSMDRRIFNKTDDGWVRTLKGMDHILQGNLPGYDLAHYAVSGKLGDDLQGFGDMPASAKATLVGAKIAGASTSKGYPGGQEASAMHHNQTERDDLKSDVEPQFRRLMKAGKSTEAIKLLADAKDANGGPLYDRREIIGKVRGGMTPTAAKVQRYDAMHPGYTAGR